MVAPQLDFDDADNPGRRVRVEAHPQTTVTPGASPGTAVVITPGDRRVHVIGDYREIHAQVQDAAARAHESGEAPRANTGVS